MVKISDLKPGDIVQVLDEGTQKEGIVVELQNDQNLACIDNGTQEFWYPMSQIVPIPITEERLINLLGFEKEPLEDGSIKYKKGPFRMVVHDPGNFTNMDIWYREDRRHFNHPLYIHELQNHHLQMTKVTLERAMAH